MLITAVLLCTVPVDVAWSVDGGVGEGGRGEAAASRRAEAARHGGGGREAGDRHRPAPGLVLLVAGHTAALPVLFGVALQ